MSHLRMCRTISLISLAIQTGDVQRSRRLARMMEVLTTGSPQDFFPNITCDWRINEAVSGPAAAVFIAVIFLLSFIANLFICLHTVTNGKATLKQSSTLLLFNLSLSNFIMTILYMPFVVIAFVAQEWIIGVTNEERSISCWIFGIIFATTASISLHTLAAISFDRCLFVVKPHLHRKIMSWKTALVIVIIIWVSVCYSYSFS